MLKKLLMTMISVLVISCPRVALAGCGGDGGDGGTATVVDPTKRPDHFRKKKYKGHSIPKWFYFFHVPGDVIDEGRDLSPPLTDLTNHGDAVQEGPPQYIDQEGKPVYDDPDYDPADLTDIVILATREPPMGDVLIATAPAKPRQ
jgi:hypothetical protein